MSRNHGLLLLFLLISLSKKRVRQVAGSVGMILLAIVFLGVAPEASAQLPAQSRRVNEPQGEKCASENEACIFRGTRDVYYGVDGTNGQPNRWVVQTHREPGVMCNNSTFGDPAVGVVKSCYVVGGAKVVALAAKAMNLVVKEPQDGFDPITCRDCTIRNEDPIQELFGPDANQLNTRFRAFHDYGFWRMTFFVASHRRPDGLISSIVSFRGTDTDLIWTYGSNSRVATHNYLNGVEAQLIGQPYAGRSGGVELFSSTLDSFGDFLVLRQVDPVAINNVPGPDEFDERFDLTVHPGWASAALTVIDLVKLELMLGIAQLKGLSDPRHSSRDLNQIISERRNQRVLVTGHSMGGAVATYVSYLLIEDGWLEPPLGFNILGQRSHNLVTFGAPRLNVGRTIEPTKIFIDEGLDKLIAERNLKDHTGGADGFEYQFVEIVGDTAGARDNIPLCWSREVQGNFGGFLAFSFRAMRNLVSVPPVNNVDVGDFGNCDPNNFHDPGLYYDSVEGTSF